MRKFSSILCLVITISFIFCSCGGSAIDSVDSLSEAQNVTSTENNELKFQENSEKTDPVASNAAAADTTTTGSQSVTSQNTTSKNTTSQNTNSQSTNSQNTSSKNPETTFKPISNDSIEVATADFAVNLLKKTAKAGENNMISPVSVLTCLGMTANGTTLKEMQDTLFGGKSIEEFNTFYTDFEKRITNPSKGVLTIANSAWLKNSFSVKDAFINTVESRYKSEVINAPFDNSTVNAVNDWVDKKTNGRIKKLITDLDERTVMLLINTLYFDMEWQNQYSSYAVSENTFRAADGDVKAMFMTSAEEYFIKDINASGFVKPYKGGFSFVGLLPDEGVTVEQYLNRLTGKKLLEILNNKEKSGCRVSLPKFKAAYSYFLSEPLKNLGINAAFDTGKADFSKISDQGLYISEVIHKTTIEVNETGTVASAATVVVAPALGYVEIKYELNFNRPFVYMIIDNQTNLPLFIGIMNNPTK